MSGPSDPTPGVVRGVLGLPGRLPFRLTRIPSTDRLAWFVDWFWISEWDVAAGRSVTARILPHPTVNLTLEDGGLVITGVAPGVFTRTLTGRDRVFGIKLRPGAARLLTGASIRSLSGTGQPGETLLPHGSALAASLRHARTDAARMSVFAEYVKGLGLAPTAELITVQRAVDLLVADPRVHRVSDVVELVGTSERRLQRLFAEYLGQTPGWVLRRGRLHAAVERLIQLADRHHEPLAAVAAEFGYAD
jgi:AraC-like DNA-binding protein